MHGASDAAHERSVSASRVIPRYAVGCEHGAAALLGCGERGVEFHGTVTRGETSTHHFDDVPNPAGLEPLPGVSVFVRVSHDTFLPRCRAPAGAKARGRSDAEGAFDTDVIGWGAGGDDSIQLCFVLPGFTPYEYVIGADPPANETNGTRSMNVTLAAETAGD